MNEQEMAQAIREKRVVEFWYNGYFRVFQPHVLGSLRGNTTVMGKQIDGESLSGEIPDWRRFYTNKIQELELTEERFKVRRSSWDQMIEVIEP